MRKAQSNEYPKKVLILGEKVLVRSNIKKKIRENNKYFEYDEEQYNKDEYIAMLSEQNDLQAKEMTLIDRVKLYRYEKQKYFQYDNHIQRFDSYDIQRMSDMCQVLKDSIIAEVNWEFSDGTVKTISDYQYFYDMKIAGYKNERRLRQAQKIFLEDLSDITIENYKEEFDKLLEGI